MPTLMLFAPAEKVLIDQQENSVSLIGIMSGVKVQLVKPDEAVPEDAAVPMRWSVLTVWKREPSDEGKTYEQGLQMFAPDGTLAFELTSPSFAMTAPHHRVRLDIMGFKIAVPGTYRLQVNLRETQSPTWIKKSDYELLVEHQPAKT